MKILTITTDEQIWNIFRRASLAVDGSIICYTSPLKALDNIDEIQPGVIVINAQEFPRHWKTLVQFLHDTGSNSKAVVYSASPLSQDDCNKSSALKVFVSYDEKNLTAYLQSLVLPKSQNYDLASTNLKCVFVNPYNNQMITGKVIETKEKNILYKVDFLEMLEHIQAETVIKNARLKNAQELKVVDLNVLFVKNDVVCFSVG
ncbi:MAG: hypothetical protein ACRC4W_04300 [Treponemataceae bacterium]